MTFTAQTRPNVSALVCPLPIRFDEHGNVRPIHTLSAEDASLIAGFEVVIKNAAGGDGHTDRVLRPRGRANGEGDLDASAGGR